MLECPHERAAVKAGGDPRMWEEHPCPCWWNTSLILGALAVLSPLLLGTAIYDRVRGIDRSDPLQ